MKKSPKRQNYVNLYFPDKKSWFNEPAFGSITKISLIKNRTINIKIIIIKKLLKVSKKTGRLENKICKSSLLQKFIQSSKIRD